MCGGLKKYLKLCFGRKIHTRNLEDIDWDKLGENDIVVYDDFKLAPGEFQMDFNGTREYRERIAVHPIVSSVFLHSTRIDESHISKLAKYVLKNMTETVFTLPPNSTSTPARIIARCLTIS